MGVYIKGMEMPKGCASCPFFDDECFGAYKCEAVQSWGSDTERASGCPLIPVPPHGLIDRERILDSIRIELAQVNAVNDMEDYDSWMRVFDYVRKFPTVIPAEEE